MKTIEGLKPLASISQRSIIFTPIRLQIMKPAQPLLPIVKNNLIVTLKSCTVQSQLLPARANSKANIRPCSRIISPRALDPRTLGPRTLDPRHPKSQGPVILGPMVLRTISPGILGPWKPWPLGPKVL